MLACPERRSKGCSILDARCHCEAEGRGNLYPIHDKRRVFPFAFELFTFFYLLNAVFFPLQFLPKKV